MARTRKETIPTCFHPWSTFHERRQGQASGKHQQNKITTSGSDWTNHEKKSPNQLRLNGNSRRLHQIINGLPKEIRNQNIAFQCLCKRQSLNRIDQNINDSTNVNIKV